MPCGGWWAGLYHYERKLGTTTRFVISVQFAWIIPLREKTGNYDKEAGHGRSALHYTTTRENWELRPMLIDHFSKIYYTTTRENWELRLLDQHIYHRNHYTTTRENWELRLVDP